MADTKPVKVGDIVQLCPLTPNKAFAYCLLTVTEVKSWGVQGYVQALGNDRDTQGGLAYYRAPWGDFDLTGGRAARVSGVEPGELEGPATRSYQQLLDELNAATVAVNELVADLQKLREKFE